MARPSVLALALASALAAASCRAAPEPERGPGVAPRPAPLATTARDANAGEAPALRERLRRAFSGYESSPDRPTLERLAETDRLVPALVAFAADTSEAPHQRANALASLRFFAESPAARAELEARVADSATAPLLRRSALRALASAYGDGALPALAPLLDHADADLRDATVRALGTLGTVEARRLLERRAALEADPNVKLTLRRALPQR